ncbi:c-type cytochrome [Novosphingobium sp.]|uniref:c-type cytochrome n=1 Tax=Novosphingobium sp. TaxID=1874826 RepID=UPI003BAA4D3F
MSRALWWIAPLVLVGMTSALSTAQAGQSSPAANGEQKANAGANAQQDRSSRSPNEALFVEKCAMCHRRMGMGTVLLARRMNPALAQLEARTDLTVDYIKTVARQGMGNMPPVRRGELSDAQLDRIAAYLAKAKP